MGTILLVPFYLPQMQKQATWTGMQGNPEDEGQANGTEDSMTEDEIKEIANQIWKEIRISFIVTICVIGILAFFFIAVIAPFIAATVLNWCK